MTTFDRVTRDSMSVAGWTLVSRATGLIRVLMIAAVLGPTFFGNLFQTANLLPVVIYELAIGSLIASLLVPALVREIDTGTPAASRQVANSFLGALLAAFAAIAAFGLLLSPVLSLVLGATVPAGVRDAYEQAAIPLLLLTIPQLVLYGVGPPLRRRSRTSVS